MLELYLENGTIALVVIECSTVLELGVQQASAANILLGKLAGKGERHDAHNDSVEGPLLEGSEVCTRCKCVKNGAAASACLVHLGISK